MISKDTFDGFVPTPVSKREQKRISETPAMEGNMPVVLHNYWLQNTLYLLIWGKRSNGKTYATLDACIEKYFDTGRRFAIIRRYGDDFKRGRFQKMFNSLNDNGRVKLWSDGEWDCCIAKGREIYLAKYDGDTDSYTYSLQPIAYGYALNEKEHDKGSGDMNIGTIVFDEFMARGTSTATAYLNDEFMLFQNAISTIKRGRRDVKVIMLANSVNPYCPYFNEMGLNDGEHQARKMKPGEQQLWKQGDSGATILCVMTDSKTNPKFTQDPYFSFGNPRLDMITKGEWELASYPHCPCAFTQNDVVFTFFIEFDGEMVQGEVVRKPNDDTPDAIDYFLYFHRKTTPWKHEDRDLIFSQRYDTRPNWRRKITAPGQEKAIKKILWFFAHEKWFVSDNMVGETIRNYIQWCGVSRII